MATLKPRLTAWFQCMCLHFYYNDSASSVHLVITQLLIRLKSMFITPLKYFIGDPQVLKFDKY